MIPRRSTARLTIEKVEGGRSASREDVVAREEPLEIRLGERGLSVTMRTPGDDFELAAGFCLTEGIVRAKEDIQELTYCVGTSEEPQEYNRVSVSLAPWVTVDFERLQRNFYTTSSCGICGKASLEALRVSCPVPLPPGRPVVPAVVIHALPEKLREAQAVFDRTGGLHAAALFDADGTLQVLKEDVGRHNAVDKVAGERLMAGAVPLHDSLMLVSGRASFEIMQKARVAGIPFVAAVGAPSSLAVETAQEFGMTLLGFVRNGGFNVYAGGERLIRSG